MIEKASGVRLTTTSGSGWLVRSKEGPFGAEIERISAVARADADAMFDRPSTPIHLAQGTYDGVEYWGFKGEVYATDDGDLTYADVEALLTERENRKRLRLEEAHELERLAGELDDPTIRLCLGCRTRNRVMPEVPLARCGRCGDILEAPSGA